MYIRGRIFPAGNFTRSSLAPLTRRTRSAIASRPRILLVAHRDSIGVLHSLAIAHFIRSYLTCTFICTLSVGAAVSLSLFVVSFRFLRFYVLTPFLSPFTLSPGHYLFPTVSLNAKSSDTQLVLSRGNVRVLSPGFIGCNRISGISFSLLLRAERISR